MAAQGVEASDYRTAIAKRHRSKSITIPYANQAGAAALRDYLKADNQDYFLEDCIEAATKGLREDYMETLKIFNGK